MMGIYQIKEVVVEVVFWMSPTGVKMRRGVEGWMVTETT